MTQNHKEDFDTQVRLYLEDYYEKHERVATMTETLAYFQLDPDNFSPKHKNVFSRVEEFEIVAPLLKSVEKLQGKINERT